MTWEEWLRQIIKDISEEYTISEMKSTEMWVNLRKLIKNEREEKGYGNF